MRQKYPPRYWDSSCFLKYLNNEDSKGEATRCQNVLQYARAGLVRLYTSTITVTEVAHIKGEKPLGAEADELIRRLFDQEFLIIQEADIFTCHEARELMARSSLKPMDAIRVATAMRIKRLVDPELNRIDTFDDTITKSHGIVTPMTIGPPDLPPYQDQGSFLDEDGPDVEIIDMATPPK